MSYAKVIADLENGECGVITDDGNSYAATFCGQRVAENLDFDQSLAAIKEAMDEMDFYPDIYAVNDHGNVALIDRNGIELEAWV